MQCSYSHVCLISCILHSFVLFYDLNLRTEALEILYTRTTRDTHPKEGVATCVRNPHTTTSTITSTAATSIATIRGGGQSPPESPPKNGSNHHLFFSACYDSLD
jgi:hypothetical protein